VAAGSTADVAELVRVLASLTPEERSALLAATAELGTRQRQHNPATAANIEVVLTRGGLAKPPDASSTAPGSR
jgi:hypothetical protein